MVDNKLGQLDDFARSLERVLRSGTAPKAILLSGGGNDVAGDAFAMLINHKLSPSPGLNAGPFPSTGATTLAPTQQATMSIPVQPQMSRGPWDATLTATLDAATKADKNERIFLRADKAVSYGDLMEVMNLLRNAGYLKIALVGLDGRS